MKQLCFGKFLLLYEIAKTKNTGSDCGDRLKSKIARIPKNCRSSRQKPGHGTEPPIVAENETLAHHLLKLRGLYSQCSAVLLGGTHRHLIKAADVGCVDIHLDHHVRSMSGAEELHEFLHNIGEL